MTSGKISDTTLMFENVVVKDSSSNTSKEFQDVSVEVVGKEIYIGSNYKVKWKHVLSLICKNDVDDPDEEEFQQNQNNDYERAGFELTCARDTKKKKKQHQFSPSEVDLEDTETGDTRTFFVRFPVPPNGHRFVGSFWASFRKGLERSYNKECAKRQKKKDRERARRQEELKQQQDSRRKSSYSRDRSSRTYSKRPYDFMRKNAANIANNAEIWSDDEVEATANEPAQESNPEIVPAEEANAKGDSDDDRDGEHDNEGESEENSPTRNSEKIEDSNSVGTIDEEHRPSKMNDGDEDIKLSSNGKYEEDEEEELNMNRSTAKASSSSQSLNKRRLKRMAKVLDDSDDEDDDIFQSDKMTMTTPRTTSQRVVTPAVMNPIGTKVSKHKVRVFLEDEDDVDNEMEEKDKGNDNVDEIDEENNKNNKKVSSFFQPRSKMKIMMSPPRKKRSQSPPRNKKSPTKTQPQSSDKESMSDNIETVAKGETLKSTNSFFAQRSKSSVKSLKSKMQPRGRSPTRSPKGNRTPTSTKKFLDNDDSDSDQTVTLETQPPPTSPFLTRSPALRAHTPKPKRMNFENVLSLKSNPKDGRLSIEEEDPIETFESSQSPSFLKRSATRSVDGRQSSSIKRRRLKLNGSRSALEALEFADTKVQRLHSPVLLPRPKEDVRVINDTGGERSPIKPLQLGPVVEMAAIEHPKKWRGFYNDGNSCYVNSSLQQIFSIPKFMQALSSHKEGHKLTATISNLYSKILGKNDGEENVINGTTISARPVKKVMDQLTNRFHGCQQRDAHEFLGEVIDQIHEELSPPSKGSGDENKSIDSNKEGKPVSPIGGERLEGNQIEPTDEYFRWNVQVCLKCKSCGYTR